MKRQLPAKWGDNTSLYARSSASATLTARLSRVRCCRHPVAPGEQLQVVGLETDEGGIEHFPTWNHDDIEARIDLVAPEQLTCQSFGPVPLDG